MGLKFRYEKGQTPIDEDEKLGLKIKSISTLNELNEFEQKNIEDALMWLHGRKLTVKHILSEEFIKTLHYRMYKDVWNWAGEFRKTIKNIGVFPYEISGSLKYLLDDTKFWIDNKTYSPEEIAIRFKHRIVSIHCFPNGNGRHSRVISNVIMEKIFNSPSFSWGRNDLSKVSDVRNLYIESLREADNGSFIKLLEFAKS